MAKKPLMIKIDDHDREAWKSAADKCGLSLSEWVRRQCNLQVVPFTRMDLPEPTEFTGPEVTYVMKEDTRQAPFKKRPPVKRRDPEPSRGPKVQEVPPVVEPQKILEEPRHKEILAALQVRKCPHGKQRGELCFKCDTKMGYPEVGE